MHASLRFGIKTSVILFKSNSFKNSLIKNREQYLALLFLLQKESMLLFWFYVIKSIWRTAWNFTVTSHFMCRNNMTDILNSNDLIFPKWSWQIKRICQILLKCCFYIKYLKLSSQYSQYRCNSFQNEIKFLKIKLSWMCWNEVLLANLCVM